MSAIGAVTGNGVYSELEYKGRKFRLSQWYADALEAVSTAAFLKAAQMARMMGGSDKAVAQREIALARSFALGAYDFDAIMLDGGLVDNELMATLLYHLLSPHDRNINLQLALEIVKDNWNLVAEAVHKANPRSGQQKDKSGLTGQDEPALNEHGSPSENHGESSKK